MNPATGYRRVPAVVWGLAPDGVLAGIEASSSHVDVAAALDGLIRAGWVVEVAS